MKYTTLPNTNIKVSKICLGTMTWGKQNTQEEAFSQMDFALEKGVNFFDTAELYPAPADGETYAETERIIGKWFKKTGKRDQVVLASKIAGPGAYTAHIRKVGYQKNVLIDAVENSLKRLKTDYLDLYQLHWPERKTNFFGPRDYKHDPNDPWKDNFNEVLETLGALKKEGKINQIGISNEKAWGTMRYLEEAKTNNLPKISTIQNPYSLLNRIFEGDLAELSIRENVGLLAYSPLASGCLSGKYMDGSVPKKSRFDLYPRFAGRYSSPQTLEATKLYYKIAEKHGLTLTQMSLAFVNNQPFLTSNIIGATTLEQLKEDIDSIDIVLSDEIIDEINKVHNAFPNPAP